jgi:hypothetical protein
VNARIIENKRGSRFYMCELSKVDASFPRYPRLPVVECSGYKPLGRTEPEEKREVDE